MPTLRIPLLALALSALVGLSGCDSAEERAEEHYQNSLELLAEGDVDRALVELRNVFELNGLHRDARLTYAEVMRDQGNFQQAYSHYLLLSEQYPNDPLPRKWLFRIAMLGGNFDEAKTHGMRAVRAAPDDPEVQAIGAIIDYQDALRARNNEDRRAAAAELDALSASLDDVQLYLPTIIDNHIRDNDLREALAEIDVLLSENEAQKEWQQLKLRLLNSIGDEEGAREQLETLVKLFPEEPDYPVALVQWHMARNDPEAAEAFLRSWIDDAEGAARSDRQVRLVSFLAQTAGTDAAIAELDRLIGEANAPDLFRAMRAGLLFDRGDRDEAIAQMEALVDGDAAAEGERRDDLLDIEVNLAEMLEAVGRKDEARERIDSVLAADSGHVAALKVHAGWLIEEDRSDDAIVELRTALGRAPEDAEIMTLIAEAHIRNGSRDLAGEMLALAVEASGNAPNHAAAYARFLMADRNYPPAENVLIQSLRTAPSDLGLLGLMGRLYVETSDWRRAEQTEARMRRISTDAAVDAADALRVDRLRAQERGDEALRFLLELALSEDGNDGAAIAVARTHMTNGNFGDAESFIRSRLSEDRNQPVMWMLLAALYSQTNRGDEAERILRDLVEEDPGREIVWRTLYETKLRMGDLDEASAILDESLAALPDAPDLLWAKAGELERDGDIDGAIGIYERLYEELPNSPIVANNLASLLSTHRDDAETLDRAYTIARRLRGSNVPAFQDTYGWIAHLRGEDREAIDHLEPAAEALPEEPIVRYRLGMAYAAAGRPDDALESLKQAVDMAGLDADRPEYDRAREEIEKIEAQRAEQENGN